MADGATGPLGSDVTTDHLGGRLDEREVLVGFNDWYRGVIVNKVDGLSLEDATTVMTPTGLSPLGIVAHLAACEVGLVRRDVRAASPSTRCGTTTASSKSAATTPSSRCWRCTPNRATGRGRSSSTPSRSTQLSADPHHAWGHVTLRWVLIHMLEETARHAGHLDLMREQIDGKTG